VSVPKGHGGPTSITLQPGGHAGRAARRFVHYAAGQWLGPAKLDAVLSVVSELVDNAALHAHTPMVLNLSPVRGEHVRIELYDGSQLPPTPRAGAAPVGDVTPPGLGLHIVQHMVTRWGVETRPDGKMVWAEV
jgi:anti-sigma regulatory factor (Ser/Thr protein kinase)